MKTILLSVLIILLLAGGIMLWREGYVKRKLKKLVTERYNVVAPLIHKLESKEGITKLEVLAMVQDPALRHGVYRVLKAYNRNDLFPVEFFTREKGAEGFLVNWLEFPTELGTSPDEIEFVTVITLLDSEPLDYYVFKYKTKTPRASGQQDWMIGVSGPYDAGSKPYDVPLRVYSRFFTPEQTSPEQEVQWVHDNISKT